MVNKAHALGRDELIHALTAYSGITTADGNANGLTLIDANLIGSQDFLTGKNAILMSGNAALEDSGIVTFDPVTGTVAVKKAYTDALGVPSQVVAGTIWRVLNFPSLNALLNENPAVPVNISAILASETNVLNLNTASTRYIVRSLRLKSANPGADTVTVRLYELINGVSTLVDSFGITAATFATYFSLMDMFGIPYLAGDNLKVTVQVTGAGGPYAVTGEYSYAQVP